MSCFFTIKTQYFQKLYQVKDILPSLENTYLNKNEWVYLFIFPQHKLIIPTNLILKKYFMNSRILSDAINSGRIEDLYHNYEFISTKAQNPDINNINFDKYSDYVLKINCEKNCTIPVLKILSNILFDKRIHNMFNYYYIQKTIYNEHNYLKTYFPFIGKFTIISNDFIHINDTIIIKEFTNSLPHYTNSIFYSKVNSKEKNIYKKIKLRKSYHLINLWGKDYFYKDPIHEEIVQIMLENTVRNKDLKLVKYKTNQNILNYTSNLKYENIVYNIFFTYTLINYNKEQILIIYFSSQDYYHKNFLFRNFHLNDIDKFICSISHLLIKGCKNYKEIEKYTLNHFNTNFYPLNIPSAFFKSQRYTPSDYINYLKDFINNDFNKHIIEFNLYYRQNFTGNNIFN